MTRPKLEVNEVWILEQVMPWEGSITLGVFFDVKIAKGRRKERWYQDKEGDWSTRPPNADPMRMDEFYAISRHSIITK